MKIKALWGFIGNALLLGAESSKVVAGQVFDKVDDEYGHTLIGKGLAEEIINDAEAKKKAAAEAQAEAEADAKAEAEVKESAEALATTAAESKQAGPDENK